MTILKDTSLCCIIRDEMMNPAGGIERFIRAVVPHVEQAIVLDTGSVDGTREKLEELQKEFSQMRVYDRKFDNYVNSRNESLDRVKTPWTLVLDADELITQEGFTDLMPIVENVDKRTLGFSFSMETIYPDQPSITSFTSLHNPRLFRNRSYFRYSRGSGCSFSEYIFDFCRFKPKRLDENSGCKKIDSVKIYHFSPGARGLDAKYKSWYDSTSYWATPPSMFEGFKQWKAYNPKRDDYY